MITVEEHLAAVLAPVSALAPVRLPLAQAHGHRLAEGLTARLAVPPFDNSAMDGYAVRHADVTAAAPDAPVRLRVVGDLPAGSGERPPVQPGTAVRIMTGAPVPPGADAVVPVEQTDQPAGAADLPEVVEIRQAPAPGAHLRRAGEDVGAGEMLLTAGTMLGALQLSAVASVGHGEILVQPRPRVGVLSTGDELLAPGRTPGYGQIPDSNSQLLAGLVREAGGEPVLLGPVGDGPDELNAVLAEHVDGLDAVVTSGGVSAGAYDVVKAALAPLGTVSFTKVAMQPGKPQGFGVLAGTVPIFCLPGNPVSVLVSFQVFVRAALRVMLGLAAAAPMLDAVAEVGWSCPPARRQYMPVVLGPPGPAPRQVRPAAAGGSGSHLVASLARAEALAVVDADIEQVRPGDAVQVVAVMMGR